MDEDTILEVDHLSMRFVAQRDFLGREQKSLKAVNGVSFSLKEGETLGVVGESGCGKSTLGKAILRLIEPSSGKVRFKGSDVTNLRGRALKELRRDMQIIFQDPFSSLNPRMSVGSILEEPFRIHGLASGRELKDKVIELLDMVGLSADVIDRYPHEFSGGQRQRIGIARAIALRPSLIIADEPVSALDVSIQSQILNLLTSLRKKLKLTYIFIAHDLSVIEHISDRVAVMYLGRIVELGTVDEVFNHPKHPYTKALLAAIPQISHTTEHHLEVIEGDVPSPIDLPGGCFFHPRCPLATDICRSTYPEERSVDGSSSMVACHHAK